MLGICPGRVNEDHLFDVVPLTLGSLAQQSSGLIQRSVRCIANFQLGPDKIAVGHIDQFGYSSDQVFFVLVESLVGERNAPHVLDQTHFLLIVIAVIDEAREFVQ